MTSPFTTVLLAAAIVAAILAATSFAIAALSFAALIEVLLAAARGNDGLG